MGAIVNERLMTPEHKLVEGLDENEETAGNKK
jgi:hypothetical protein